MKKIFISILIFLFISSLLSAGTISWKWRSNDSDVKFYRYRMDNSDWNTVESESFEVRYDVDTSVPHSFEIQQSYDGENWSDSGYKEYIPFVEEAEAKKDHEYSKSAFRVNLIPHENITVRNSNTGVDDYYAEYSFGLETNGTIYINRLLGFGISGSFNGGIIKLGEDDKFYNFGLYLVPALRIISNNNLELSVKGGVGVEIEPYRGVAYMAPSFLAQIDASVFLSDHFSIAISPSVVFNNGDFLGGSTYQSSNIRILSIGASWNY